VCVCPRPRKARVLTPSIGSVLTWRYTGTLSWRAEIPTGYSTPPARSGSRRFYGLVRVSRVWSLSGSFGRSAFPWHTDGAISSRPPRWIVLRAVELSERASTELMDPSDGLLRSLQRTVLVARDRLGRARYLPAYVPMDHGHRVRWDPRTCRPRSEETAVEVAMTPPSAAIEWRPDLSVVIDNYRLMHRRPAVGAGAERVLERTYVWS
jgi:hypothetical protein